MLTADTAPIARALAGMQLFADDVRRECMKKLAAKVKEQTKARIASTKKGPDGAKWERWSDSYAETRSGRHSLLVSTGLLSRTLSVRSSVDGITISSPRTYAAAVQSRRPFLGIGSADVKPLERMLGTWAQQEMRRRVRK